MHSPSSVGVPWRHAVSQLGPNQPENVNKAVRELLTPTALENAVLLVYQATGNKEIKDHF